MEITAFILVCVVILLQTFFMLLEMFLWKEPYILKAFKMSEKFALQTEVIAKNQGLYNGFLALGLFLSFFLEPSFERTSQIFFLSCVLAAGLYGAYTTKKTSILWIQALPALLALLAVLI